MSRRENLAIGLLVLFVGWLASIIFPQSREWWLGVLTPVGHGLMLALRWLWTDVSVPRAVFWLMVMALVSLFVWWRITAAVVKRTSTHPRVPNVPVTHIPPTDDQRRLLEVMLEIYPRSLDVDHARRAAQLETAAHAERVLESLIAAGMVEDQLGTYCLTKPGRDFGLDRLHR